MRMKAANHQMKVEKSLVVFSRDHSGDIVWLFQSLVGKTVIAILASRIKNCKT